MVWLKRRSFHVLHFQSNRFNIMRRSLSLLSCLRLHPLEFEQREIYAVSGASKIWKCPPLENYVIVIVIYTHRGTQRHTEAHTYILCICHVVSCIVRSWIDCLRVQVMRARFHRSTFQRQPNDQPKYNKEKYTNTPTKKKRKKRQQKKVQPKASTHIANKSPLWITLSICQMLNK